MFCGCHEHNVRHYGLCNEAIFDMVRRPLSGALLDLVGMTDEAPRYRQVYRTIRDSILAKRLHAGDRLPSTRTLAAEAGLARKTIEEAYAQLEAEGYLVRRTGAGSFVADVPLMRARSGATTLQGRRTLSARGRAIASMSACVEQTIIRPFAAGMPAVDAFPIELWNRIVARHARKLESSALVYGDPAGHAPLREAIAAYLGNARGVRCDASQVLIVSSSQQALDLVARLTLDPGDEAWIENPGYFGARAAFLAAGANIVAIDVDDAGLDVDAGQKLAPDARLAYVTPSHQFPLGATMSLDRRLALLAWARKAGAWIIEDDYDGEFRYDERPVPAIQGLDDAGRVIYVGTFTKSLYPSLRLAYLVLPPDLAAAFVNARSQVDGHAPPFMQGIVAEFMTEGHFGAHIRRMRALYHARRDVFLEAAHKHLRDLTFPSVHAGLRATGIFRDGRDDRRISERAARAGIDAPPLSRYFFGGRAQRGLVLGYAALTPDAIRKGIRELAKSYS
jgi:GntR family transcriptional regulator/MocR family aminotransferase